MNRIQAGRFPCDFQVSRGESHKGRVSQPSPTPASLRISNGRFNLAQDEPYVRLAEQLSHCNVQYHN
jgi:hypothetical protein